MLKGGWIQHRWGFTHFTREQANKVASKLRRKGWEIKIEPTLGYTSVTGPYRGFVILKRNSETKAKARQKSKLKRLRR